MHCPDATDSELARDPLHHHIEGTVMTERYQKGLELRRAVLGPNVDRIVEGSRGDINENFQNYLTEFVWGDIWSRDGLGMRERSLVTIAMLMALNRPVELKTNIRGALSNGATAREIEEVFLQGAAYCGFPASMASLRIAKEVLDDIKAANAAAESKPQV